MYFGNEIGTSGTRAVPTDDFIAVQIENGLPTLSVNLGSANTLKMQSSRNASDGHWRRVTIERTGKSIRFRISSDTTGGSDEKRDTVAGPKSVLNLHQTLSKFYVGGVPESASVSLSIRLFRIYLNFFQLPADLKNRHFIGDIEQLSFHGEQLGLWNSVPDGTAHVTGAERRSLTISANNNGK